MSNDLQSPVLSKADLQFWEENGYVVAQNAVSEKNAARTAKAIWDFLEMDPEDPKTWYTDPPRRSIMVEIYHHQAFWDNRQAPRVHQAFSQIWGTERLWVSFDRGSMNPPTCDPSAKQFGMHWDANLDNRPVGFGVQGVLYLTNTAENQGAFQCVPGFHNIIEDWLDALPEGEDPRRQDLHALGSIRVPANPGDLIIWRTSLPHFASLNTSNRPRIAQYITMNPANDSNQAACQSRVNWWQERLTGLGKNAKEEEHYHSKTAKLTPLGRKLLGMDKWD